MTPTPAQIEAVRRTFPAWEDWQIVRHLSQREQLARVAAEQRRARFYVPQPMAERK